MTRTKQRYVDLGYKFTKFSDLFDVKVKDLNKDSNEKVEVYCDDCGKKMITPYRNYNRIVKANGAYRCRKCNAPYVSKIRIENNTEKMIKVFNELSKKIGCKSLATTDDYRGVNNPLPLMCQIHGKQFLSISQLRTGCMCPKCGSEKRRLGTTRTIDEVNEIVSSKHNNILLNKQEYINGNVRNMKIQCGICNNVFITSITSYKHSNGYCPLCAKKVNTDQRKLSIASIKNIATFNGKCYVVNPEEYHDIYAKNLEFICTCCGKHFVNNLANYKCGYGVCPKCSHRVSRGEYIIANILEQYNIRFEQEKRFDECRDQKPLPFDFFIPSKNLLIEFDGEQHYKKMRTFDTDESFAKRQYHDKLKTEFCKNSKIDLLRIPYWEIENISKILSNKLNLKINENIIKDIV